ncbi:MAG: hypothetical protein M0R40_03715 [Firmicutes bacterium]|nr:hypothetical protein [Bacillota bacterium]
MKKRLISWFLTTAMLATMLFVNAAMVTANIDEGWYDTVLFEDDFSSYTKGAEVPFSSAWDRTVTSGRSCTTVDAADENLPDASAHGIVAKIAKDTSTNSNNYFRLFYSNKAKSPISGYYLISELRHVKVEYDVLLSDVPPVNVGLRFFDNVSIDEESGTKADNLMSFGTDSTLSAVNGSSMQCEPNIWYSFEYYLNFDTGKYTAYVNGAMLANNAEMPDVLDSCAIAFGFQMSGTTNAYEIYFDNAKFSIPNEHYCLTQLPQDDGYDLALFDDNFEGYTPGTGAKATGLNINWDLPAESNGRAYKILTAADAGLPNADEHGQVASFAKTGDNKTDDYFRIKYGKVGEPNGPIAPNYLADDLKYVKAEFDILLPAVIQNPLNIRFYNILSVSATKSVNLGTFSNDVNSPTLSFSGGKTIDYGLNQWYNFVYYFDLNLNTYTAYVNGRLVANEAAIGDLGGCMVAFGLVPNNGLTIPYEIYFDNARFSVVSPYPANKKYEQVLFYDNFANTPLGTVPDGSGGKSNYRIMNADTYIEADDVDASVDPTDHGNVFKMTTKNESNAVMGAMYSIVDEIYPNEKDTGLKSVKVECDIKLNNKFPVSLSAYTDSNFTSLSAKFEADGSLNIGGESLTYEAKKWYNLAFEYDYNSYTYNAYLDGALVAENVKMGAASRPHLLRQFRIQIPSEAGSENVLSVDNYKYSVEPTRVKFTRETMEKGKIFLNLHSQMALNADVVQAKFANGTLKEIKMINNISASNITSTARNPIGAYTMQEGEVVKTFLWDGLEGLKPFDKASEIKID